jgi:hypothetical protein
MTTDAHRMTVDIVACVRCGGDHDSIHYLRRTKPVEVGGHLFTKWILCPTTNEVVHLRISGTEVEQA